MGSCASREETASAGAAQRHVVVLAIDALRFDHTGLGGYAPPTTPNLDRLGADSLVFTSARAASSYTLQSVSALMSGRLPTSGGSIGLLEAQPAEAVSTLATTFRRAGYRTALATNQPLLSARGFTRGFDDVAVARAGEPMPCSEVARRGLDGFGGPADATAAPRFLYLQLVEPHEPHTPPDDVLRRFAAGTEATARDGDLIARYDAEIATADACVGQVVEALREHHSLDDTVLVVLGTQGEELGEHGDTGSGWTLYDEVLRVPLVVRAPGLVEPGRTDAPASIVDLHPTLLALASIPAAPEAEALDGRALLAERGGRWRPTDDAGRAVIAELVIPERAIVRTVIENGAKYIASIKSDPPAERDAVAASYFDVVAAVAKGESPAQPLWGATVREELYDLAADPGERDELLAAETGSQSAIASEGAQGAAATVDRLRSILGRYEQRCREHGLAARQAKPRAALPTEEEIKNLKSLSYL